MRIGVIRLEPVVGLALAMATGLVFVAASDVPTKYKLAAVLALAGSALLIALPERRIACVILWILIHPFSIEKVFPITAAEGPQFSDPTLVINASDGPLALLALFLLAETALSGRSAFVWSRLTTILLAFLGWSALSYAIHANLLDDGFTTSSPLALLQDLRLLIFVLLMQSAIRTRGEVVLALLAVAGAVAIQTGFVALSYFTGHLFSYAVATNGAGTTASLQGFATSGEGELSRASGTVGQINEQAMFHAFMTIPLIGFFAAGNRFVRVALLCVVAGSALALVLTFSRGAWLAFPSGLTVCGLIAFRRRMMGRTAALVGASFALVGAVALIFLAQPIYQRLAYGDTGATASRLRMLQLAGDLFLNDPVIGVGPGEYVEAALKLYPPLYRESQWVRPGESLPYPPPNVGRVDIAQGQLDGVTVRRPLPAHNKYMLVIAEIGLPGLLIWLWFFAAFVRIAWRCSRNQDPLLQLIGIGGIGVATAELLYMLLDLFVQDKPLEIMLFTPALLAAASRCPAPSRRRATSSGAAYVR